MPRPAPGSKSRAVILGFTVFGLACAAFVPLAPRALANGDAAVYAQQIETGNFSARTTHIGFYFIGSLAARTLPEFSDYAFNLTNVLLAALTLTLAALCTFALVRAEAPAMLTGVFLASNFVIADSAVFAEVYMAQALLLLLALCLWRAKRALPSAGSFAASALVSPSSVFALPSFVILRPALRPLLIFSAAVAVLLTAGILPVYQDYFSGGRGLLRAAAVQFLGLRAVLKEGYEVVFGFLCALPFAVLGLWRALRQSRLRDCALAALSLWAVSFFLGEKFNDVPVQLPFYVVLGIFAGIGGGDFLSLARDARTADRGTVLTGIALVALAALVPVALLIPARQRVNRLAELPESLPLMLLALVVAGAVIAALIASAERPGLALRSLVIALVAVNGVFMFCMIGRKSAQLERYRESVLAAQQVARPGSVVVGGWDQGILFNHYVSRTAYSEEWLNVEWLKGSWGDERQLEGRARWEEALASGKEVWLLGDYPELGLELEDHGFRVERFGEVQRATPNADGEGVVAGESGS